MVANCNMTHLLRVIQYTSVIHSNLCSQERLSSKRNECEITELNCNVFVFNRNTFFNVSHILVFTYFNMLVVYCCLNRAVKSKRNYRIWPKISRFSSKFFDQFGWLRKKTPSSWSAFHLNYRRGFFHNFWVSDTRTLVGAPIILVKKLFC